MFFYWGCVKRFMCQLTYNDIKVVLIMQQTNAWSHIRMCCEGMQVIWQDYQYVCQPPLFSLCQLPAIVESPWEPLQHMTWISMSFRCHWPLCPTLLLKCSEYTCSCTHTHTCHRICKDRHMCWGTLNGCVIALLRRHGSMGQTGSCVLAYVFYNSTRRMQRGNVSARYCT